MNFQLCLKLKKFANRSIHMSHVRNFNPEWRKKMKLPIIPNAYGPLTDLADYKYLDNRPTPYGIRQRARIEKNREIATKIIQLTKEVDFAVKRYNKMQLEKQLEKNRIIDSKLKPKGDLLDCSIKD